MSGTPAGRAGPVLLLLAAALLAPGSLAGQSAEAPPASPPPAATPGPHDVPLRGSPGSPELIGGFWGLPWGADSTAVRAALGEPVTVARLEDGLDVYNYTPALLGKAGFLNLWVHEERGLVRGTYEPFAHDCTDMLRRIVREVKRAYREVPMTTEGRVPRSGLPDDLCVSAMEGEAEIVVVWEDRRGRRLTVGATRESPAVRMVASTPWYRARRP